MIADRRLVHVVERLTVRCDECPRQVSVYVATGTGNELDEQLAMVGWSEVKSSPLHVTHYCEEHS
jgi:hypothetical protein